MLNRYAFFYFDFWRASVGGSEDEHRMNAARVTVLEAANAADAAFLMGRKTLGRGYAITAELMEMEATEVPVGEYLRRQYDAEQQKIKEST